MGSPIAPLTPILNPVRISLMALKSRNLSQGKYSHATSVQHGITQPRPSSKSICPYRRIDVSAGLAAVLGNSTAFLSLASNL